MSFELSNKRIGHLRDIDTLSFCNISQRLGSKFSLQLFSSNTKNLGSSFKLRTTLTWATMSTTFRATSRANIVHHVSNTSGELSKLCIGLSLSVLTRSNLFIKMSFELSNKRIGYFRDIDTLRLRNVSK